MDTHRGAVWTSDAAKAGLIRFYRGVNRVTGLRSALGFYARLPRAPFHR
jgi:hypothetical protein